MSRHRLWIFRLVAIGMSFAVSLVLGEFIVRVYRSHSVIPSASSDLNAVYEFSRARHHRLVPNAQYRHHEAEFDYLWINNSLGMRDQERSTPKAGGSFRILFLGDSMVQGYGVPQEQTMVALLETSLNQPRREKQIEVLNGGVFGYSPVLEYLQLKEIMPLVDPDLVVVGFFLGNDVGDDYFYTRQASLDDYGEVSFARLNWPWDYKDELLKNRAENGKLDSKKYARTWMLKSSLIRLFVEVYGRWKTYEQYRDYRRREARLARDRREDIRVNLGSINYPAAEKSRRLEFWEISKSYLKKIQQLCQRLHVPMILAVIPAVEADTGAFNEFQEPTTILKELGKELTMPIVFLLNDFHKWPANKLHFELDGHWNVLGNRVAAKAMDQQLRSLNLLPGILH